MRYTQLWLKPAAGLGMFPGLILGLDLTHLQLKHLTLSLELAKATQAVVANSAATMSMANKPY